MPLPTVSDLHVDTVRTELSIAYMNQREFLAADAICPIVQVSKQSDYYGTYSREDFMRVQMGSVGASTPAPIMSFGVSKEQFFCLPYSGKVFLPDQARDNAKNEYEIEKAYVAFVNHQAQLKREAVVASKFWTTSVWATDYTPGTKWSSSSSTPFADLRVGCRTIQQAIGWWPTDLVLGADCWDTLCEHADTLDRIKGGATTKDPANVRPEQLAQILGLKRVTIAAAAYNTSSAGVSASMSPLYDTNDALLIYRPDSPTQFVPSGAYCFSWSPYDKISNGAAAIRTWREDDPQGEWFLGEMNFDPKVTCSYAGYFFNEATA